MPFAQKQLRARKKKKEEKSHDLGFSYQGRKRNPNPNFLVRIFSGGVGVFHVKGWGPKSSVCRSKPGKSNFSGGISRDFAGFSRRCPRSLRKKVCVQFSSPIIEFFRGRPRFPSAPDPLFKASKGTLSHLKTCNPVGGTPSSTS